MIVSLLKKYSANKLFRNLSIVFLENITTKALSFITILILSRNLGAKDYGKYSLIFVSVAFCSAFFDFGMENTAVRFSARKKDKINSIFGTYLISKLIISLIFILLVSILGRQMLALFGKSELSQYILFFTFGFLGESLFFINDTYLQAKQNFKLRAFINISRYFLLVLGILLLQVENMVKLKYVVFLYFLPLIISFGFILNYVSFIKQYFKRSISRNLICEIFQYQKWMFLISIPNNTLGRIDFFLISFWVTYDQIAIYNLAFQLSAIVSFIPFVFGKVILPKMSEYKTIDIFKNTKKIIKPTILISAIMLLLIPFTPPIVTIILGEKYINSISILQVMLLSSIIAFIIVPIEQALYSLGKPMIITVAKYTQIFIIILLIFLTVPALGIKWAALSVLFSKLVYGLILSILYTKSKKNFLI